MIAELLQRYIKDFINAAPSDVVVEDEDKALDFINKITTTFGIVAFSEPLHDLTAEEQVHLIDRLSEPHPKYKIIESSSSDNKRLRLGGDESGTAQYQYSRAEMQELINKSIMVNRDRINQSNKTEFLAPRIDGAARTTELNPNLNRKEQIRLDIVDNKQGPLDKTKSTSQQIVDGQQTVSKSFGVEERLQLIEQHTGILPETVIDEPVATSEHAVMYARIKRIEDWIMNIEQQLPALARMHFKAHQSAVHLPPSPNLNRMASKATYDFPVKVVRAAAATTSDNNSNLPQTPPMKPKSAAAASSKSDNNVDAQQKADGVGNNNEDIDDDSELEDKELNKRINDLKNRLIRQK